MAHATIPILDLAGTSRLEVLRALPETAAAILAAGRRAYGRLPADLAGRLGRRWIRRNRSPYAEELAALADAAGDPAVLALNLAYEWCCSSLVGPDPGAAGARLLRTLDWPLAGLGGTMVLARLATPAGPCLDLTWPGFAGSLTVCAPGRFAAAINQAPMRRHVGVLPLDWLVDRVAVWRTDAPPPSHLLRLAAETCPDFAAAKALLRAAPICLPAFFALTGTAPGEACIIERDERGGRVFEGPVAVANDWLTPGRRGRARGADNQGRRNAMATLSHTPVDDFAWVAPPIRNPMTRLAARLNAARGEIVAQGWEAQGPVTLPTAARAAPAASTLRQAAPATIARPRDGQGGT